MHFIELIFVAEVIGIPINADLETFSIETSDQIDLSAVIKDYDDYDYGNYDDADQD